MAEGLILFLKCCNDVYAHQGPFVLLLAGILECWKNGILIKKTGLLLIFVSAEGDRDKMRYHPAKPNIPTFHYSSIPFYMKTAKLLMTNLVHRIRRLILKRNKPPKEAFSAHFGGLSFTNDQLLVVMVYTSTRSQLTLHRRT